MPTTTSALAGAGATDLAESPTDASTEGPTDASTVRSVASPHTSSGLHRAVTTWYRGNARDLPWRSPEATPWGVLVSEVMLQQTPVVRVEPAWRAWQSLWPGPAELAAASPAEVLRAWGRLGYPRRALRLQACAVAVVERFAGELPADEETLRTLPGVGEYTAAAVAAFAYGRRAVVLDTNVRRVLGRAVAGEALPAPSLTRAERARAAALLPEEPAASAVWNVAVMELGALVCSARSPGCDRCPIATACVWRRAGYPADEHAHRRRGQAWNGTDRQVRGAVMALLRDLPVGARLPADALAKGPAEGLLVGRADQSAASRTSAGSPPKPEPDQVARVLAGLIADGLIVLEESGYALPE